jgi:uncharacterized protein
MRRSFLKLASTCALALLATGWPSIAAAGDSYRFGVSSPGGAWYPIGTAISRLAEKAHGDKVSLVIGGGAANALQVNNGELEFGITYASTVADASGANPPFKEKAENLRIAVVQYPQVTTWVVFRDSGIQSVRDLKGKRVNVMPRGFSQQFLNVQMLKVFGMSYDDFARVTYLGLNDAIAQMKDGHLDANLQPGEEQYASLIQLKLHKPIRILSFTDEEIAKFREINPGVVPRAMPKESYDLEEDVKTIQSYQVVVTHKDTPAELVYKFAKLVYDNKQELINVNASFKRMDVKNAAEEMGIPRHPGLTQYLKEIGAL